MSWEVARCDLGCWETGSRSNVWQGEFCGPDLKQMSVSMIPDAEAKELQDRFLRSLLSQQKEVRGQDVPVLVLECI